MGVVYEAEDTRLEHPVELHSRDSVLRPAFGPKPVVSRAASWVATDSAANPTTDRASAMRPTLKMLMDALPGTAFQIRAQVIQGGAIRYALYSSRS